MDFETIAGGFRISLGGVELLRHTAQKPMLQLAKADFHYTSRNGQHTIHNHLTDWVALQGYELLGDALRLFSGDVQVRLPLAIQQDGLALEFHLPPQFNYARLSLPALPGEAVYGGGMQFSRLNLRGRQYPIWTCEAGVGRNKRRLSTILADLIAGAGGDHWTTYHPRPAFLTPRGAGYLLESDQYCLLDFRGDAENRLEFLGDARLNCLAASGLEELVKQQARISGIQPPLPDWVFEGGILGIQGGLPFVSDTLDKLREAGAVLSGVWTQDWQGVRMTPTGKRLFWNWQADEELYPQLAEEIHKQAQLGTRWMGYLNPYFNAEGEQFKTARKLNYLVKDANGQDTFRLISEFTVGMLDLTNPQACTWYKEIIQKNLLALGLRGWMADYGEDITESHRFTNGANGIQMHNAYPRLWARMNREAVEEAGLHHETLVFHRSGAAGQNRWFNCQWGGDQLVGWDKDDGFPSAVTGGLSAGMSGIQYYHSDAGGYTTLGWYKRSPELLARWSEANAFSPILRTHEGNRPWVNAQPWTDSRTIQAFVRATRIHAALAPYLKSVSDETQRSGLPMMRPFCLRNPQPHWKDKKDAWYLGQDVLVFPVMRPGLNRLKVEIPEGEWIHCFSGQRYGVGTWVIDCPLGQPPAFYRAGTTFQSVFERLRQIE